MYIKVFLYCTDCYIRKKLTKLGQIQTSAPRSGALYCKSTALRAALCSIAVLYEDTAKDLRDVVAHFLKRKKFIKKNSLNPIWGDCH